MSKYKFPGLTTTQAADVARLSGIETDADTAATQSTAGAATAATVNGNLGAKTDFVAVPYQSGINTLLGYTATGYQHVHGEAFLFPFGANPLTITSNAAAWTIGTKVQLIAAGATDRAFDLHWMQVGEISANGNYELLIYAGPDETAVMIGAICFSKTDNFSAQANQPVQIPQQAAGTRISVALRDSTTSARTCIVKTIGHYYG